MTKAKTKLDKTWDAIQLRTLSQRYHTNADDAQAAGLTPAGFRRICKRLGVVTPAQRNLNAYSTCPKSDGLHSRPPIKRLSHLRRFLSLYEAMGIKLEAEWDEMTESFTIEMSGETRKMRGDAYVEVQFDRHGTFRSQTMGSHIEL